MPCAAASISGCSAPSRVSRSVASGSKNTVSERKVGMVSITPCSARACCRRPMAASSALTAASRAGSMTLPNSMVSAASPASRTRKLMAGLLYSERGGGGSARRLVVAPGDRAQQLGEFGNATVLVGAAAEAGHQAGLAHVAVGEADLAALVGDGVEGFLAALGALHQAETAELAQRIGDDVGVFHVEH